MFDNATDDPRGLAACISDLHQPSQGWIYTIFYYFSLLSLHVAVKQINDPSIVFASGKEIPCKAEPQGKPIVQKVSPESRGTTSKL